MNQMTQNKLLCFSVLLLSVFSFLMCTPAANADVMTDEGFRLQMRESHLRSAVINARKRGTFAQQLAAAKALEQFCTHEHHPFGESSAQAKLLLADVYWVNGYLQKSERTLADFMLGHDRAYAEEQGKIVSRGHQTDEEMVFRKWGAGSVHPDTMTNILVYLADVCNRQGNARQAALYFQKVKQCWKEEFRTELNDFQSRSVVERARIQEHPLWNHMWYRGPLWNDRTRFEFLGTMLTEAPKYGNDSYCVVQVCEEIGRFYEQSAPSLAATYYKRVLEISSGSSADGYLRCMDRLGRRQDGWKVVKELRAHKVINR